MSSLLSQITEGAGKLKPRNKNKVTTTPVIQQISDNPLIASITQPSQQTVSTKPLYSQSPYDSLRGVNELLASLPSVPNRDYDSLTGMNEYIATLPPVPPSKRTITQFLNQNPIPNIIAPNLEALSDNQLIASVTQKPTPPPQKITKEENDLLQQTLSTTVPNVDELLSSVNQMKPFLSGIQNATLKPIDVNAKRPKKVKQPKKVSPEQKVINDKIESNKETIALYNQGIIGMRAIVAPGGEEDNTNYTMYDSDDNNETSTTVNPLHAAVVPPKTSTTVNPLHAAVVPPKTSTTVNPLQAAVIQTKPSTTSVMDQITAQGRRLKPTKTNKPDTPPIVQSETQATTVTPAIVQTETQAQSATEDDEWGEESVESLAAKIVKADVIKAKLDKLDKTKTPAQILVDNKMKFRAIDDLDEKGRSPGQHAQHAALRKEVLVAAAIVKFETIDKAISEINTLIAKIENGQPNEMISGGDLIAFNKILALVDMRWKTKSFSNAIAIKILNDNKDIMSSINKIVDIAKVQKPQPPSKNPSKKPPFGSTVQSIRSNDTSPIDYPIDISSNVSR